MNGFLSRDKVRLVLDLSKYATKKINDGTGVDTSI